MMIDNYQMRVIGPTEVIDYSNTVKQAYPVSAIQSEPFVGFKVLCRDTACGVNPAERLKMIDMNLGFLRGSGCLIRETSMRMPDGFWIITMPVPRSQMMDQINKLTMVLAIFERNFGIVSQGMTEINVSGRCHVSNTERCLCSVITPRRYQDKLVTPDNSPYRLGHVVRINDWFMVFRTRWQISNFDDISEIAQLLSAMYH